MFEKIIELIWEPPRQPYWYEAQCPCIAVFVAGVGGFFLCYVISKARVARAVRAFGLKTKGWILGGQPLEATAIDIASLDENSFIFNEPGHGMAGSPDSLLVPAVNHDV